MIIAVSVDSDNIDGKVSQVFGRCAGFILLELDSEKIASSRFIENPALNMQGGAGVAAAQVVAKEKPDAAISGNFGPNSLAILQQAGIKTYLAKDATVKQAVELLQDKALEETGTASVKQDFGKGA